MNLANSNIWNRYLVASCALVLLMAGTSLGGSWSHDFWEHSAVVKELATHPLDPVHPLLLLDVPHAFYSPYSLATGLFSKLTSLPPASALAVAGMFNLVFLLVSFRFFVYQFFDTDKATISFYGLFFVLFLWPAETAWHWSGFIHFGVLWRVLPYPSTFAIAATLLILALYSRALHRQEKFSFFGLLCCLSAVVILTHPTTAIVMLVGIGAISLQHSVERGYKALAIGVILAFGALSLAFVWPYYSFFDLIKANNPDFHQDSIVLYQETYSRIFPVLFAVPLTLPIIINRLRANRFDALVIMFCATFLIYIYGYLSKSYGFGRVISFLAIIIQIFTGVLLAQIENKIKTHKYGFALPFIIVIGFTITLNTQNKKVITVALDGIRGQKNHNNSSTLFLAEYTQQYDVILSDLETSWKIPTYGGKVIASKHPAHWVDDHDKRRVDLQQFFSNDTKVNEKSEIIERYRVNYILIDTKKIRHYESFYIFGDTIYENKKFILIKINDTVSMAEFPGTGHPPVH